MPDTWTSMLNGAVVDGDTFLQIVAFHAVHEQYLQIYGTSHSSNGCDTPAVSVIEIATKIMPASHRLLQTAVIAVWSGDEGL